MSTVVRVCVADYANPLHAKALVNMLDSYAKDPMGGGEGLSSYAKANVVSGLSKVPLAFSVLAFAGETDETAVGLANCLQGFSTFACKPLINVHDLAVIASHRGQRIGESMLALVEDVARQRGACKITLEVLSGNERAMRLYSRAGFANYELDPSAGHACLMQKWLD